jgi:hypothetical protein
MPRSSMHAIRDQADDNLMNAIGPKHLRKVRHKFDAEQQGSVVKRFEGGRLVLEYDIDDFAQPVDVFQE